MRVSARAEYGVRALTELGVRTGVTVTAEEISNAQGIPLNFLLAILGELRQASLVRSQRGPSGGYLLDREPGEITVADVMRAVEGPLASVHGVKPEDVSYPGSAALLRDVWIAVRSSLRAVLEQVTIEDLVAGTLPTEVQALLRGAGAWERR